MLLLTSSQLDAPVKPTPLLGQPYVPPGATPIPPPPQYQPYTGTPVQQQQPAPTGGDFGMGGAGTVTTAPAPQPLPPIPQPQQPPPGGVVVPPPQPPPPPPDNTGPLTTFGPGNDLRSTQINPVSSDRLVGMEQQADTARAGVAGFGGLTPYSAIGAPDVSQAQQWQQQAAGLYGQQLGPFQGVATSDPSQVYSALDQARAAMGGASPAPSDFSGALASIDQAQAGPADYSAARGLYGQAAGEYGQAQLGQFGSIDPTQSARAQELLGQAAGQVQGIAPLGGFNQIQGPQDYQEAADVQGIRGQLAQGLQGLAQQPDRQELASRALQNYVASTDPQFQAMLRDVGQRASAYGRIGSGVTTSELGDLGLQRAKDLNQRIEDAAIQTAQQQLQDRLNTIAAQQSGYGALSGQDLSTAGFRQGLRQEARGERQAGLDYGALQQNQALQRAQALQSLGGQQFDIANTQRNQLASERDTQSALAQARANLALQRGGALAGLGSAQAGISSDQAQNDLARAGLALQRGTAQAGIAGEQFGQGLSAAQLGLARGGALAGLAGQQFDVQNAVRNQAVGERDAQLQQQLAGAQLGLNQAQGLAGLGQQSFAQQAALRGMSVDEALRQQQLEQAQLQAAMAQAGQLQGFANDQYSQEAAQRGELRGERGYQTDLAQQALLNRISQAQLQDALLNSATNRNLSTAQLGLQGAEILGQQGADQSGAGQDLLNQLAIEQYMQQHPPAATTTPDYSSLYTPPTALPGVPAGYAGPLTGQPAGPGIGFQLPQYPQLLYQ